MKPLTPAEQAREAIIATDPASLHRLIEDAAAAEDQEEAFAILLHDLIGRGMEARVAAAMVAQVAVLARRHTRTWH